MSDAIGVGGSSLSFAGESVHLLAERALYWPRMQTLIVADLHLAKADVFRARGIPIPAGTTAQTLKTLDTVIAKTRALSLLVLGDFLHAKESVNARAVEDISAWRARHARLELTIVEGNHDRSARTANAALDIRMAHEPYVLEPFAFCHELQPNVSHFQFAGHVHPYAFVRGTFHRARVPCFVVNETARTCVLPAFGAFTGGINVATNKNEVRYACVGEKVIPV